MSLYTLHLLNITCCQESSKIRASHTAEWMQQQGTKRRDGMGGVGGWGIDRETRVLLCSDDGRQRDKWYPTTCTFCF